MERILSAVEKDPVTGCWNWLGSGSDNYGYIFYEKKNWGVHRLMFVLTSKKRLRKGDEVMHICDNSWCCNPDHLTSGTHGENMDDRSKKGRNGFSKIDINAAKQIRIRYSRGESSSALAAEFGLSPSNVHHIAKGRAWKTLNTDPEIMALTVKQRHERTSVLSEADVRDIKRQLEDGCSQKSLAEQYGVHSSTISHINTGKKWKHVE